MKEEDEERTASEFERWRAEREKAIREAEGNYEAPTGLPTSIMKVPEGASEEEAERFREARARWVVPPDGWEEGLDERTKKAMQLWDLPQLRKMTAYEFVGALCTNLGGRPAAVRAALGLQVADSVMILAKRSWMTRYTDEMKRIDKEKGLDTPAGQYEALKWMQINPKNPEGALKAHTRIAALHGMILKKSAVITQQINGAGLVTAEEQAAAIREGTQNWLNTAGKKILAKSMIEVKAEAAEAEEALSRWTPPEKGMDITGL